MCVTIALNLRNNLSYLHDDSVHMLVPSLIKWEVMIRNLGLVCYLRQACNIIFENEFDEIFVPLYLVSHRP